MLPFDLVWVGFVNAFRRRVEPAPPIYYKPSPNKLLRLEPGASVSDSSVHSKLTARTWIVLGSIGCLLLGAAHSWLRELPTQKESYEAAVTGSYSAHPEASVDPAHPLTCWASDERGPGTVSIGPFPAPNHLRFAVRGNSKAAGTQVYLELQIIRIRIPIAAADSGPHWSVVDVDIPFGWRGRLITLDATVGPGEEFAVTQPFGPGTGGTRQYGLMETLTAWLANGILYGAVFVTLARFFARREFVAPCWVALAAGGAIALLGYAAFRA
jgi:hypothetical protein